MLGYMQGLNLLPFSLFLNNEAAPIPDFLPFAAHRNGVWPAANKSALERSDVKSVFGNKGNKKADQGTSLVSPCSKIAAVLQKCILR